MVSNLLYILDTLIKIQIYCLLRACAYRSWRDKWVYIELILRERYALQPECHCKSSD